MWRGSLAPNDNRGGLDHVRYTDKVHLANEHSISLGHAEVKGFSPGYSYGGPQAGHEEPNGQYQAEPGFRSSPEYSLLDSLDGESWAVRSMISRRVAVLAWSPISDWMQPPASGICRDHGGRLLDRASFPVLGCSVPSPKSMTREGSSPAGWSSGGRPGCEPSAGQRPRAGDHRKRSDPGDARPGAQRRTAREWASRCCGGHREPAAAGASGHLRIEQRPCVRFSSDLPLESRTAVPLPAAVPCNPSAVTALRGAPLPAGVVLHEEQDAPRSPAGTQQ